jgi:hypothetical protein
MAYLGAMMFEIEFFHISKDQPDGVTIRRNHGQFASERDAETYALTRRPDDADGFRIWKDGIILGTVSIRAGAR